MARLLGTGRYQAAQILKARKTQEDGSELLILELDIPLGQRPKVNDIRSTEVVAIAYVEGWPPNVYPLRDDFPDDVPHFNLAWTGRPRSLCLFDLAQEELLRLLTPHVLLERTRFWMVETAYGRLHGEDQPLDPLFGSSGQPVVLPPTNLAAGSTIAGFRRSDAPGAPVILKEAGPARAEGADPSKDIAGLVITSPPLPHGRIRAVPRTIGELVDIFAEVGADLLPVLQGQLRSWYDDADKRASFEIPLLMVIATPIERHPGQVDRVSNKAFLCKFSGADLAVALGVILREKGVMGLPLGAPSIDTETLNVLAIFPMDVHQPFTRELAQQASGLELRAPLAITLVGAGALGSQIAITAAREGLGVWTIYDADSLMPHNLARHALSTPAAGTPKAAALAIDIKELLDDPIAARGLVTDVRRATPEDLGAAELVIDASASVPVSRWLAHGSGHGARTASTFFNPRGEDLVILIEAEDRAVRLDELEMSYYWRLASTGALAHHLHGGSGIVPAGGCRSISMQVPQSRVAVFAGLAVRSLLERPPPEEGLIEIWRLSDDGLIVHRWSADRYRKLEVGDWSVLVRETVIAEIEAARARADSLETGGILVGTWDRQNRRAYVVGHYDPPPDSVHSATGFVRGLVGVYHTLQEVEDATAFNLSYIGEWHTHPSGSSSRPSQDDDHLLRWIGEVLSFSDAPPLMIIGGEDGVRVIVDKISSSAIAKAG